MNAPDCFDQIVAERHEVFLYARAPPEDLHGHHAN